MVLCENPERMSKSRIGSFITKLPEKYMKQIAEANLIATGAVSYLDAESLMRVWKRVTKMNSSVVPA